jgi:diguanylate cyclase (GGDEF)-like protein
MTRLPLRLSDDARGNLRAQRLDGLYNNTSTEVRVGGVVGVLVAVSVWGDHTQWIVVPWLAAVFVIYAVRWGLSRNYRRSFLGGKDRGGRWLTLYVCGAAVTGTAWGLLDIALAGTVTPYQLSFALLCTCCLSIMTLPIYRGALYPVVAMTAPALLPPIAYFIFHGGDFFLAAAIMLAVFMMVLIGTAAQVNKTLSAYIQLQEENRHLSSQIQNRKEQLSTRDTVIRTNAVNRGRAESALQRISDELAEATRKSKLLAATLVQISPTCPVTGLISHRHFLVILDTEWRRLMRAQKPLSLIVFDFDDGESNREFYRSAAGSECLRGVARLAKGFARRAADIAFRIGERRFGLLLPGADTADAYRLADKLRQRIEAHRVPHNDLSIGAVLTVHAGIATRSPDHRRTSPDLLDRAESALAAAQRQGGNRVVTDQDLTGPAARAGISVGVHPGQGLTGK